MINPSRRRFFMGAAASLLAAPAIVRVAANLMPVSSASKYDMVREIFGWDAVNDIRFVRYDVIVAGRQWGMDQEIAGSFRPNKRDNLDRLFSVIEEKMQRPIYAAELIRPANQPGYIHG